MPPVHEPSAISASALGSAALSARYSDEPRPGGRRGTREDTRIAQRQAVERACIAMRQQISAPVSLRDLACAAMFSPYHFHRMFRAVTGVPPARFLTGLRMEAACRLLLTTRMRVTDVCFEVGFSSLGTFTTSFARVVGVTPQQLRCMAACHARRPLESLVASACVDAVPGHAGVSGWIDTPPGRSCVALLGLSTRSYPYGHPSAWALARAPGPFVVRELPPGDYFMLVAGFRANITVPDAVLLDRRELLVGAVGERVRCRRGERSAHIRVGLHPASVVDPPSVLAGPLLFADRWPARGGRAETERGYVEWRTHKRARSKKPAASAAKTIGVPAAL